MIDYIDENVSDEKKIDAKQIIEIALYKISSKLNFTVAKNNINPNKLIESKTAHCIGYASFFSSTCNYLFKKHHINDICFAQTHIGQLYICNLNIHKYLHSPFFKDHDFVIIRNRKTGE